MQFKNSALVLFALIALAFTSVHARICKTQMGVAWCENDNCYWKDGSGTFKANYCNTASRELFKKSFNGSNCRKCASTSCAIIQRSVTAKYYVYHHANGYYLTANGW